MEYEVRITLQAQAHLREIRDYIAQKLLAPEAAKNTVQRLGTVMASLSQMPKRVPLVEEEPWRSEGVRVRAVRNFLIYFWVNEAEKTVQVIAVIYARRDQTSVLWPLPKMCSWRHLIRPAQGRSARPYRCWGAMRNRIYRDWTTQP